MNPDRRSLIRGLATAPLVAALPSCRDREPDPRLVEDVAKLGSIRVAEVFRPTQSEDLADRISRYRGPISIGGARYSMGGQIAAADSLHIDLRGMTRLLWLDRANRRVRIQAGASWRDLQEQIDPQGLAVKIMQSYSNFSIGGSVSVNCHGRYVGAGPVINSVRAMQLLCADGTLRELSREQDPELFGAVAGGYGGLGVVTEVELDLDLNEPIERRVEYVALQDYPDYFRQQILEKRGVLLHNADLTPPRFDHPLAISWLRSCAPLTRHERLVPRDRDYAAQQNLLWVASELPVGERLRTRLHTQPLLEQKPVVWRNLEASLDADSLEPRTRSFSTYLLQEYFIPVDRFRDFVAAMHRVLAAHPEANVLNVSIRHSPNDATSLLAWTPGDTFCFVLYHKQRTHDRAERDSRRWVRALIDAALSCGGRYYLPYRLHATPAQFVKAYPEIEKFALVKRAFDPERRFRNALWDRYLPS